MPPERCGGLAAQFTHLGVRRGSSLILDDVSASVPVGSSTAIIGPNGAGKTTMLLALLGEIAYTGEARIARAADGRPLRLGYVPQRLHFDRAIPITVLEFMVMGAQKSPLFFGVRRACRERASALLESVGMGGMEGRRLGALSGGEMQRVLLAMALGQNPELLLLDEPAAGVDSPGETMFCELLEKLRCKHGFTQLMVSHNLSTVTHHATHVICLNRRMIAEGAPREVLTPETLIAIFGVHMGLADQRVLPCCEDTSQHSSCPTPQHTCPHKKEKNGRTPPPL